MIALEIWLGVSLSIPGVSMLSPTVISVIAVSLKVTVTSKAPFLPCAVAVYISKISAKHKIVVDNT